MSGRRPAWLAVWLVACTGPKDTPDNHFALSLDRTEARAGDAVAWTGRLHHPSGHTQAAVVELSSSLQPSLIHSGVHLFPRVAGTHVVRGATSFDGRELTDRVTLQVGPGPAASLELGLDAHPLVAGSTVEVIAQIADAFGNDISPDALTYTLPPELVFDEGRLTGSTAGAWTVLAEVDGLERSTTVEVVPADPSSVALSVEVTGPSVLVQPLVADRYGNRVDGPVELRVDGLSAHTISGSTVLFREQGHATIQACAQEHPDICSAPEPVLIDWSAPVLEVTHPPRGTWWQDGPEDIVGTVDDLDMERTAVSVLGAPVEVAADGSWTASAPTVLHGMVRIEAEATDGEGRRSRDTRAVVVGDLLPPGAPLSGGLFVRLQEDTAGLGALEALVVWELSGVDLVGAVPDPVYDESDRSCVTPPVGPRVCVDNRLTVSLTAMGYDQAALVLDGQADGSLRGELVWTDFWIDRTASGLLSDTPFTETGRGTADTLTMTFELAFAVGPDGVAVTASDVEVSLTNFDLGLSSELVSLGSVLGAAVDVLVGEAITVAASEALPPVLEATVEDALAGLSVDVGWAEGSSLVARPSAVEVDETGLAIAFASTATVERWVPDHPELGALSADHTPPDWQVDPSPAAMALSYNLLNQIFHANWGGGILEAEGGTDLFQIDPVVFGAVLPGISELVGTISATYPSFFVPDGAGGTRLDTPELRIDFYDRAVVEGLEVYTIYVVTSTPVDFALMDNRLDILWGTQDVWMDVERAPAGADLYFLEALLESFTAGLLLEEYELVDALPLPEIGGVGLQGQVVSIAGADGGYVLIGGEF